MAKFWKKKQVFQTIENPKEIVKKQKKNNWGYYTRYQVTGGALHKLIYKDHNKIKLSRNA